ncbi:MAG: hypothetical protein A2Y03_04905 [Omnitrophica WOR_2 bacterium GWF2_38_59]|nr:MAG: hypothetical protein A2Y03_04905 [Omnitrophica WOR_2 bacterium GWF2_38_59]OGX48277.1 MAG: hypothetical protein A2243_10385 [Omnitrophica WOR_2 bacterium RIFOXYA2_FULL_38_17]OGX54866.1 MAG: hypothetical protein A2267_01235 [Omnitrophica WOR_2 bacterium RIFOXYA12_FULL_38_10]OGX59559.1 MAG: hypothetical protein A2447_11915 [Omnitrophica WOR_2 bacterium RIFOXYC2_FULL_38_12]OGX59950.1 MAG: hypothetical protein A2306_04450 [Omnitrophica WOR_2 bacterium RIFOXYB2_FULL_38_16]
MVDRSKDNNLTATVGTIILGLFSLFNMVFNSTFAELHIKLSCLDFPIFIGEILMFICLIWFFFKDKKIKKIPFRYGICLIVYLLFILLKAIYGYFIWGPLAFRHAALFYYPIFAFFSYSFYSREYFDTKRKILIISIILLLFISRVFVPDWIYTCLCIAFVLVLSLPKIWMKVVFITFLLVLTPYRHFMNISRMGMLSNVVSIVFTVSILCFFAFSRKRNLINVFIVCASVVLLLLVISLKMNKDRFASIFNVTLIKETIAIYDKALNEGLKNFTYKKLTVKLYNENPINYIFENVEFEKEDLSRHDVRDDDNNKVVLQDKQKELVLVNESVAKSSPGNVYEKIEVYRMVNIVFRLFIWTDVVEEIKTEKKMLGLDFGKPFRSKRLEILNWGTIEWQRDGWIAIHNSYLNLLYRGGIVGVFFIVCVFVILFRMIKYFIIERLLSGILLCSVIIYWMVSANFLTIFELPQYAIPFWIIFGFTFAYYLGKKNVVNS